MYPIECRANFFVPLDAGMFEIIGVQAVVSDTTLASRITIIDDPDIDTDNDRFGKIRPSTYDEKKGIIDVKGIANIDCVLEQLFPEPIKTRNGLSIVESTNIVPGTLKVYIR